LFGVGVEGLLLEKRGLVPALPFIDRCVTLAGR